MAESKYKGCINMDCPKGVLISSGEEYCSDCLYDQKEVRQAEAHDENMDNLMREHFTHDQIEVLEWIMENK